LESIFLPELTTVEGEVNFDSCTNLVTAFFPKLENLTYTMFYGCNKLKQLEFPSVTKLSGNGSLSQCKSLVKVVAPALTEIRNSFGFYCDNLEIADFTNLKSIVYSSQIFSNCPKLKALVLRGESMVTLSYSSSFNNKDGIGAGTGYIYVPSALVETYKSATNWSVYATQFRALEDYTIDGTITGELDEAKIAEVA
jgi:hypothetical protein